MIRASQNRCGNLSLVSVANCWHVPNVSLYVTTLLLLLVSACTSVQHREPATVEERIIVDGQVLPYPEEAEISTEPLGGATQMSPVVQNLLSEAISFKQAQNYDGAAESLERALRIEARNATVWHELADLSLVQQHYNQAIQFAQKSNTLSSPDDIELKRRNWNLISIAYASLGNPVKAAEYRAKVRNT